MYRIELAPGQETALRTIDELATGIRNGIITSRARIWHNAGQKWLPIEFHPHYQAALKQLDSEPSSPSTLVTVPFSGGGAASAPVEIAKEQPTASLAPTMASEPAAVPPSPSAPTADRQRSLRRPITLAAGGMALIAGVQIVASAAASGGAVEQVAHMAAVLPRPRLQPTTAAVAVRATATTPVADRAAAAAATDTAPPAKAPVAGGSVVHGPELSSPAPLPPAPEPRAEENEIPPIAPLPAITELPVPPMPTDSTN